ncbi:alpha-mannosyl-glycoprotein beta-2-n [Cryptosporidium sp. chipmunk genotype I]|uniref:alpha-mannosyl-glycoprotein beta-2-n n=1 Tax=Cryptosporidium sp. chipmunk genotype I TaxID=1280935 RepID=UPI003519DD5A|nr:alpha-mannosyl-glycoprotein beta-2-n [Cryptosporidium sp. chipmunk genotype I]
MIDKEKRIYQERIFLDSFDYSELEKTDPTLSGGFNVVYRRTCPVEIRLIDSDGVEEIGTVENINFRVMIKGTRSFPDTIRFEITCDNDLFLFYTRDFSASDFNELKVVQNLVCDYSDFTETFCRIVNNVIQDQLGCFAKFCLRIDGSAKLTFIQVMEYKFLELLSVDFQQTPEEIIRNSISFRYSFMKSKVALMEGRFLEISNLLSIRNPNLLHYLQKNSNCIKNKY